jgi:hypothetical protein
MTMIKIEEKDIVAVELARRELHLARAFLLGTGVGGRSAELETFAMHMTTMLRIDERNLEDLWRRMKYAKVKRK